MFSIGDSVRVKAPFTESYPGQYVVTGVNPETGAYQIDGVDFAGEYLEAAT